MMIQNDSMETPQTRRAILVVEDNDMNRELLCAILEDSFDVLEAENGLVGLEQLERNYEHLSLVLLDVYMPVCDGFEFLRRKQAEERFDSVPVIVTTASNALEDEIECLRLGANDFVIKPYNVDIILNRINNIIHLRESASIVNQLTWDNLTGLYSREFFFRHVNGITSTSSEETFDIVCCKIMNFSMLNDRYGKSNCDGMVRELASRISGVLPDFMAGGRLGNEVFGFLIKHQEDPNWTQCLSETAKGLMATNLHLNFGIMESISRGLLASRACDRALLAMEEIRDTFGVSIAWYNDELREKQVHEHVILETMEQALEEHQFTVYYQPKHDTQTEEVGGAEALVRWIHPDLGFVRPDHFIPVFERNGFITKLDLYVFEETCRQITRNREQGLPMVPISVNVSRLDFDLPNLVDLISELADRYDIPHSMLHVELTETAYSENPGRVIDALQELQDRGFLIELDDFGSGYSSLASLNDLALNVMKLDMGIIRQAARMNDYRIVAAAIKMAQFLGLTTVAEGVETAKETERLKELGCNLIQGYYFSKPLNREEFEKYLARQGDSNDA
jgi:EAL domain-containing protein (putative c-di-GMP-specific phosphodiesterase class I)/DNA-binding response OmpR family regulator